MAAAPAPVVLPAAVGDRVVIAKEKATVRYIGEVAGQTGTWIGVEWDDAARGKHDGTAAGVRYFSCHHALAAGGANAAATAGFLRRWKAKNPALLHICDPVIGDDDLGVFVAEGLIEQFRDELTPMADIITPNQFELGRLVGERPDTVDGVIEATRILNARGTGRTVVTGCVLTDTAPGEVETVAVESGVAHRTSIPRIPIRPSGTGDLFTAYLTGWLMRGEGLAEAAARTTAGVQTVLLRTQAAGAFEMRLTEG
jgi:pyridoxine kinase